LANLNNPACTDLEISWLFESPLIDSIQDIPNDQGRQVRVFWTRNGYDFVGSSTPIIEYSIFRQIDPSLALTADILQYDKEGVDSKSLSLDSGRRMVTMPEGNWDFIMTIPADTEDGYAAVVPTLADSTIAAGSYYSTFLVRARTATPGIYFDSPVDSGYSVDNLEPNVPAGFAVAYNTGNGNELSWDPSMDPDLQYFRIYRDDDQNFVPSQGNLVDATTANDWTDPSFDDGSVHYKVTAVDFAGNESDPSSPETVTAIEEPLIPVEFALYQNVPNPFNPTTVIAYDVPHDGDYITLRIFSVRGRLVRTLVNGRSTGGHKKVSWDARDEQGQAVSTGVYFYQLSAGDFMQTRKLLVMK